MVMKLRFYCNALENKLEAHLLFKHYLGSNKLVVGNFTEKPYLNTFFYKALITVAFTHMLLCQLFHINMKKDGKALQLLIGFSSLCQKPLALCPNLVNICLG